VVYVTIAVQVMRGHSLAVRDGGRVIALGGVCRPRSGLQGVVWVELDLIVRSTNSRYNYVFDFYQREATIKPI
jgi:hypothetical protein